MFFLSMTALFLLIVFSLYTVSLHGFRNQIKHQYRIESLNSVKVQQNIQSPCTLQGKSRNEFISKFSAGFSIFSSVIALNTVSTVHAVSDDEIKFINSLSVIYLALDIIKPTLNYVEIQAYDNARTNIKYILNQLQIQNQIKSLVQLSIDFCDDMEVIDAAQEAGSKIANTLIQFDSTVYTCVFIPSDDGTVPPSAEKYRKQTIGFYNSFVDDMNALLRVGSSDQLASARALANKALLDVPKVLFKDVKKFSQPSS